MSGEGRKKKRRKGCCHPPAFIDHPSVEQGDRRDSNPRRPGPQPGALPTELRPPSNVYLEFITFEARCVNIPASSAACHSAHHRERLNDRQQPSRILTRARAVTRVFLLTQSGFRLLPRAVWLVPTNA